jgi:hypothetical protein
MTLVPEVARAHRPAMNRRIGLAGLVALCLAWAAAQPAAPFADAAESLCPAPAAKSRYNLPADRVEAFRAAVRSYFQAQGRTLAETPDGERLTQFDPVDRGQFMAESGPGDAVAEMVDLYPACDRRLPRSQKALWTGFERHMRLAGFSPRLGL